MRNWIIPLIATMPFAVACSASFPVPTQRMADAEAAERSAREVGADTQPTARLEVKLADEQIARPRPSSPAGTPAGRLRAHARPGRRGARPGPRPRAERQQRSAEGHRAVARDRRRQHPGSTPVKTSYTLGALLAFAGASGCTTAVAPPELVTARTVYDSRRPRASRAGQPHGPAHRQGVTRRGGASLRARRRHPGHPGPRLHGGPPVGDRRGPRPRHAGHVAEGADRRPDARDDGHPGPDVRRGAGPRPPGAGAAGRQARQRGRAAAVPPSSARRRRPRISPASAR